MKRYGTQKGASASPHKEGRYTSEDIKFDASQYEFFGRNVVEHELEQGPKFDKSTDHQHFLSSGKLKGKYVGSQTCVDDLAISFTKLNKISEPTNARAIIERRISNSSMPRIFYRRKRGTVKWYNNEKGYGFITPDDGGGDVFVHYSSLKCDGCIHLCPGTHVEFESIFSASDSKMQAINVSAPYGRLLQDSRKLATCKIGIGPCFNCGQSGHVAKNCCLSSQQKMARQSNEWENRT
ncbi:uncharacterized protein LOC105636942 [Jatropha curcas]|uniref:uncharacterized protein LOC105636942 n=1 Tax=Jatropha curcas TaxID=180498 RepID=UPI0018943570|nr:uncharacterized protein LOC105636942 [Jatropha curcas]